jgi:acyl dehydratase
MTEIRVGQVASVKRTFTQSDFDRFAVLSGDDNPIHVDPEFAAVTKFGRTVAHGMFLYSVVCGLLSTQLPGPGTSQLEQSLMFPNATYTGQEVEVRVEVTGLAAGGSVAELTTSVVHANGNPGLTGSARVELPGAPPFSAARGLGKPGEFEPSSLKGLEVGQRHELKRAFSADDLAEYADLTGDHNPLVVDAAYARRAGLQAAMVPGGLLAGLFSTILGTKLPGQGTNYLKQSLVYLAPAFPGQRLTASAQIVRIRPEKQLVNLATICAVPSGEVVCAGEALVLVSDVEAVN